jgi:hypothetical protein
MFANVRGASRNTRLLETERTRLLHLDSTDKGQCFGDSEQYTYLAIRESPNSWAIYVVRVCMKLLILCLRSLAGFRLHLLGYFFFSWVVGGNFPRAI